MKNYVNKEFGRKVYKDYSRRKISCILKEEVPKGSRVLIVFWHGLGDLLMFLPLYNYLRISFPDYIFDLCLQPGTGQLQVYPDAVEMDESQFVKDHHTAFVLAFHMIEGSHNITKAEYCCEKELGVPRMYLGVYSPRSVKNKLIALHLQGTCLPGSTNPDDEFSKKLCSDIIDLGYVPFDVHMLHSFHNPVNKSFAWQTRSLRDLKPDIAVIQNIIQQSHIFIGVASGPFVMALGMMPRRVIYLEKAHSVTCYVRDFNNVLKISDYSKELLSKMIGKINTEIYY